jgi:hypothetical protein
LPGLPAVRRATLWLKDVRYFRRRIKLWRTKAAETSACWRWCRLPAGKLAGIIPDFWQKSSGFFDYFQIIFACFVNTKP